MKHRRLQKTARRTVRRKKIYQPHLSTANDARAIRTREALRNALLKLLETQPLEQITILDIAAKAGIGYTTFFRHHPTKESLLNDLAAEEVRRLVSLSLPRMGNAGLGEAAMMTCRYVDEHRALWTTLLTGGAAAAVREAFLRTARQIVGSHKFATNWIPPEVGVAIIIGGFVEVLAWWLRQTEPVPIEKVAAILDRVVVSPVMQANL